MPPLYRRASAALAFALLGILLAAPARPAARAASPSAPPPTIAALLDRALTQRWDTLSDDEKTVFDLCDRTFTTGRIGLWTKSDAVTYFDDLQLQKLK